MGDIPKGDSMALREAEVPEDSPGLRLKLLRTARRWTLREVTRRTGIPPSNLSSYELNKIVPPTERLMREAVEMLGLEPGA
jgi:transcriptional regulator with XRE-family HTH domain